MRVLALAEDATFLVSLSLMAGDWEVVSFADVEQAVASGEAGFAVAVVDLKSTERGLAAVAVLRRTGRSLPCVVVGDEKPSGHRDAPVLVRPFTLDELVGAMEAALAPPAPARPAPAPSAAPAAPAPKRRAPAVTAAPAPNAGPRPPAAVQAPPPRPAVRPSPPKPAVPAEAPARAPRPAASTILAPERPASDRSERSDRRPRERDARRPRWGVSRQGKSDAEPRPSESQPRRLSRRSAGVAAAPGSGELLARLELAARGIREAAAILEDMPFLADARSVASALVAEITERFSAKTVALYVPDGSGGFDVLAAHGLSAAEQRMSVPADHPLLAEVAGRFGALLIAPVEMAQGLVAGIGGSRTSALMAAPLSVGGVCEGVAIAGSDQLADTDLDALVSLTAEAAPGLAIARWLRRLAEHASTRA